MVPVYQLTIGYVGVPRPPEVIQATFPFGSTFARIATNVWLIKAPPSGLLIPAAFGTQEFAARVRAACSPADNIFVCQVNLGDNGGFLQEDVWRWINQVNTSRF